MNVLPGRVAPTPLPAKADRLGVLGAFVAWAMMLLMTIVNLGFSSTATTGADANPIARTAWFVVLAVSLVLIALRMSLAIQVVKKTNVFFLLFLFVATVSVFWSIDPDQTVRRLVRLAFMLCGFLAITLVGWNRSRFQQLFRPVLSFLIFGSLLFGAIRPDLAIHQETDPQLLNAWRGLFLTKNDLGPAASLSCLFWLHAFVAQEVRRPVAFLGILASVACVLLSRSSTSLMSTVIALAALLLLMRTPGSMRRSVPFFATALILLILLYSMAMLKVLPGLEIILSPIPMITGKDLTFTGRAEIWAIAMDHIQLRPWLGSGYSAYWLMSLPTPQDESYLMLSRLGFYPGSCHNGYLQILNDLGYLGLFCLLGYLVVYFRQSLRLYATDREQGALFLALFLQQAMLNLAEPLWLNVLIVDFVLVSAATMFLARARVESTLRPAGGRPRRAVPMSVQRLTPRPPGLRRLVRHDGPRNG